MKRRKFLGGMSAVLGGVALSACGGGGQPDPTKPANGAKGASSVGAASAPEAASSVSGAAVGIAASTPTTVTTPVTTSNPSTPDTTASAPVVASDPSTGIPTPVVAKTFYGVNGHFDYTYTPAQTIALLTGLGCTTYRLVVENFTNSLSNIAAMAKAFDGTGLTLFVGIDPGYQDANGNTWTSEQAAYNEGFTWGSTTAKALAPYGITMYECGNELTRRSELILNSASAGNKASDFNNANWPLLRGLISGMIAGVKSIQPTALCGVNFCVADIGASDALWNGTQPDSSSGYAKVRWDITTWHNYEVYGDIFNIGTDGAGPGFDLPAYCKSQYGVPFMLTEWNANPEDSQTTRATYITNKLTSYYAARKNDNIDAVIYYELDSGDTTWGLVINGTPNQLPYNAMKNFIASNPDN